MQSLSARVSLDYLKQQAKEILRAIRAGDHEALRMFRRIPRFTGASFETIQDASPRLQDAQHALALDYGFANWSELVHHVARLEELIGRNLPSVGTPPVPPRIAPSKVHRLHQSVVDGSLDEPLLN